MKAAVWYKQKDVRIEALEEPVPGSGEVKVKVKWCGICGSDLHGGPAVTFKETQAMRGGQRNG